MSRPQTAFGRSTQVRKLRFKVSSNITSSLLILEKDENAVLCLATCNYHLELMLTAFESEHAPNLPISSTRGPSRLSRCHGLQVTDQEDIKMQETSADDDF